MSEEAPKLSPSLTILKFLVMAMGITMIVGFLFLLGVIYKTVGKDKQDECVSGSIALEAGTSIRSIARGDKRELQLLIDHNDGSQSIAVINHCKGTVLRTYDIQKSNE